MVYWLKNTEFYNVITTNCAECNRNILSSNETIANKMLYWLWFLGGKVLAKWALDKNTNSLMTSQSEAVVMDQRNNTYWCIHKISHFKSWLHGELVRRIWLLWVILHNRNSVILKKTFALELNQKVFQSCITPLMNRGIISIPQWNEQHCHHISCLATTPKAVGVPSLKWIQVLISLEGKYEWMQLEMEVTLKNDFNVKHFVWFCIYMKPWHFIYLAFWPYHLRLLHW